MFENTHAHITTWVIALILFLVALGLHNAGKKKGMKIVQMILRLFYILIIVTGAMLFFTFQEISPMWYGIKFLVGIWVIAMLEMILVKANKGKKTGVFWILLIIALIIILYLGFELPNIPFS
jgi:hypothetical protein